MKAKKSFGQHFLTQDPIAERLASALHTDGCGAIVEVGPGKGILTKFLLKQPLPVVAVELDRDMIPILEKEFSGTSLRIVQADILHVRFDDILPADVSSVSYTHLDVYKRQRLLNDCCCRANFISCIQAKTSIAFPMAAT